MQAGNYKIGERLSKIRKRKLISQKDAAAGLNIDQSKISRHESGTFDLSTDDLIKYASFYNVSADYILGIEKVDDRLSKSFNAYKLVNLSEQEIDELDNYVDFIIFKRKNK